MLAGTFSHFSPHMGISIRYNELHGDLIHGFSMSDVLVTSGDERLLPSGDNKKNAHKLIEAKKLFLRLWFDSIDDYGVDRIEIEGASADSQGLDDLISAFPSSDKSASIKPLDFILTSSDLKVPEIKEINISELSLKKDGDFVLHGKIGNIPFSSDPNSIISDLSSPDIVLQIGDGGRARVKLNLTNSTEVITNFYNIDAQQLLDVVSIDAPLEGRFTGYVDAKFPGDGITVSGDIKAHGISLGGVPLGSFGSPFLFSGKSKNLSFPKIAGTMPGMENLKGSATMRTDDVSGKFFLHGDKLSLGAIQRTFKLDFPVSGEGGAFKAAIEFSEKAVSGDLNVNFPNIKIENQNTQNLSLAVKFRENIINFQFGAKTLGAPTTGEGTFSLGTKSIDLKMKLANVNAAYLSPFIPQLESISPKGTITAEFSCKGTLDAPAMSGSLKSGKLSLSGVEFRNLAASISESGAIKILSTGNNATNITGQLNFAKKNFSAKGSVQKFSIPDIKGSLSVKFDASGGFENPSASLQIYGKNNSFGGYKFSNTTASAKFENYMLNISSAKLQMPQDSEFGNASIGIKGSIDLMKESMNLSVELKKVLFRNLGMKDEASGTFKVSGRFSNPRANGTLSAKDFELKLGGGTDGINFDLNKAKIGTGNLRGNGSLSFGKKPEIDLALEVENLEVRPLLEKNGVNIGLGGMLTGDLKVKGQISAPKLSFKAKYPLTFKELLIDKIFINISPNKKIWNVDAGMSIGEMFSLKINGTAKPSKDGWTVNLSTGPLIIKDLLAVRAPALADKITGKFSIRADIEGNKKSVITIESEEASFFGFRLNGLRVPIEYTGDELKFDVTRGNIGGALIKGSGRMDLKRSRWRSSFTINGIRLEPLTEHILAPKGGKLLGLANMKFMVGGNLGIMPTFIGAGYFSANNGELSGLAGLKGINSEGKIEFEKAGGRFVFNGSDVTIFSGYIDSKPNDKHYRYVRFSGPLGFSGKGMNLRCSARIDIGVFNLVMGAFEGIIGFASGENILKSPIRAVAENLLGLKVKSFSQLTFRIIGGWGDPIITDVKLEKQMSNVAYELGKEKQESSATREIDISIQIPVGPGSSSESAEDAIMRGLFDGIFDNLAPKFPKI